MRFWYHVCWWIARIGLFFWHPVFHVEGRAHIPAGSCVFCANHSGMADPIWILLALPEKRMIRIMAKQELRRVPFVGWVMEKFRVIFVNRGAHDIAAYQQCIDALEQEHDKMLVFIEGTRCNRDKHVRAKTGAVHGRGLGRAGRAGVRDAQQDALLSHPRDLRRALSGACRPGGSRGLPAGVRRASQNHLSTGR